MNFLKKFKIAIAAICLLVVIMIAIITPKISAYVPTNDNSLSNDYKKTAIVRQPEISLDIDLVK